METNNNNKQEEEVNKTNKTWAAIMAHQGDIKVLQSGLFL